MERCSYMWFICVSWPKVKCAAFFGKRDVVNRGPLHGEVDRWWEDWNPQPLLSNIMTLSVWPPPAQDPIWNEIRKKLLGQRIISLLSTFYQLLIIFIFVKFIIQNVTRVFRTLATWSSQDAKGLLGTFVPNHLPLSNGNDMFGQSVRNVANWLHSVQQTCVLVERRGDKVEWYAFICPATFHQSGYQDTVPLWWWA